MTKRFLSMLLAIMMVVGLMPAASLTALAATTTYDLWVGGEQVTSEKLTVAGTTGTATYDPDTNTLTLNDYTYEGAGHAGRMDCGAIYYGGADTLKLVLVGENSITHTPDNASYSSCIYVSSDLMISGNGDLTANGGAAEYQSRGIHVDGNITLSGGSVTATGGTSNIGNSSGVYSYGGTISVSGGKLAGNGGAAYSFSSGLFADDGNIIVLGGELVGTGGASCFVSVGLHAKSITVSGGTAEATGAMVTTESASSRGAYTIMGSITVSGGSLTATGGTSANAGSSYGVWADMSEIIVTDGSLIATGGKADSSEGAHANTITVSGGVTVAQGGTVAFNNVPTVENALAVYDANDNVIENPSWQGNGALTYAKIAEASSAPTAYTVTVSDTIENGTVEADVSEAAEGDTVTLTVTPAEGYELDGLTVTDANGSPVTVENNTFKMPASDVTVTVTFKAVVAAHYHPVCGTSCDHTGSDAHSPVNWIAWASTTSLPTEAGCYYLTNNVTVTGDWDVPGGDTKICLNGYTLKTTSVIADGETLTICDCKETGKVYSGSSGFYNSRSIVNNSGTFNLYSGSLSGNFQTSGGAAGVRNKGTFNMYGGYITKNTASSAGGGVYNESGAVFNMYGGYITENNGGTGGGLYNSGKFNMYGGEITGNKTDMDSYGGVYSASSINVSGKVIISGNKNKDGSPSNYCSANNGAVIVIAGSLEEGSSIGVTRYQNVGAITTGGDEYIDYFFSDNAQYFVEKDGDNLKLSEEEFTVTVTSNNSNCGTASADLTSGVKGTKVTLSATPAEGYRLKEWKLLSGEGTLYQSGTFNIGTENAVIQAVFEEIPKHTVTVIDGEGSGTYAVGDTVTIKADNPPTGSQFTGWTVTSGSVTLTDASAAETTFTMPAGNVTVSATFKLSHIHGLNDGGNDLDWIPITSFSQIKGEGNYYLADGFSLGYYDRTVKADGAKVNLCLNGQTITYGYAIIVSDVTLSICDCSADGAGSLVCKVENSGTINLYSGTVGKSITNKANAVLNIHGGTVADTVSNEADAEMNMYGGKLETTNIGIKNSGTVNISGGTVTSARNAIEANSGKVTVSDTAVISGTGSGWSTINIYKDAVVNITGGTVKHDNGSVTVNATHNAAGELNISGGTVTSSGKSETLYLLGAELDVTITGGSITNTYGSASYASNAGQRYGWAIDVVQVKSLTISGSPVINRIYLPTGYTLTIGESGLNVATPIEIHCATYPTAVTGQNSTDYSSCFTPRNGSFAIANKDNTVWFTQTATVVYTDGVDGKEIFADQSYDTYLGFDTPAFAGTLLREGYTFAGWSPETGKTVEGSETYKAQWTANTYTVTFDSNGGAAVTSILVTYDQKYGRLPSTSVTGLSGGDKIWYLVDENGNVTDINITANTVVSAARDHTLMAVRKVLAPTVSVKLTAPGCISDSYAYYNPADSTRILTASIGNKNDAVLDYTYQWYKDGTAIDGAESPVLTLDGNVSDSGTYKVVVTASLKSGAGIVVTEKTASGEKEQKVKIARAANTLLYDANGGTGGATSNYSGGATIKTSGNIPAKTGYTFAGWDTAADGSGERYAAGELYTFVNDNGNGGCKVTLYAQWTANTYTVVFDINGGYGSKEITQQMTYDVSAKLTENTYSAFHYYYNGWNTKADGSGTSYADGAEVINLSSQAGETVRLYAQWIAKPSYDIKLEVSGAGKASLDMNKAIYSETVRVRIKADETYSLLSIKAYTSDGTEVELKAENNAYSFSMPAKAVTVKVVFEEARHICPSEPYSDVDTTKWYHEAIDYVIENGLMIGTEEGTFAPHLETSRAMIATILYRLEGEPEVDDTKSFPDVKQGVWYTDAIAWAEANGIVIGYDTGNFEPERNVSRQELAVILYRYAAFKGMDTSARAELSEFADESSVSSWAKDAVQWAVAVGILEGDDEKKIEAKEYAERCEVAAMIRRFTQE